MAKDRDLARGPVPIRALRKGLSNHRVLDPRKGDRVPAGLTALAVMTKAPQAGRVKTRLTPPLSPQEAATLNTCFLRDTAAAISRTAAARNAQGVAVYTPAGS